MLANNNKKGKQGKKRGRRWECATLFYSQHLISLYHSLHWNSCSLILPLNERIRLRYHMLSFCLIRGASGMLWHDQKPKKDEIKRKWQEMSKMKEVYFFFSFFFYIIVHRHSHCVHTSLLHSVFKCRWCPYIAYHWNTFFFIIFPSTHMKSLQHIYITLCYSFTVMDIHEELHII